MFIKYLDLEYINSKQVTIFTYQLETEMTKYQEILKEVKEGKCTYGNHNTTFILTKDEMIMCELHKDCKYTFFYSVEKFARRISKFYKTGY